MANSNQIPHHATIVKLPYLELWVNSKLHVFEQRFSEEALARFFKEHLPYKPVASQSEL